MIQFNLTKAAEAGGFPWGKVLELLPQFLWPVIALILIFGVIGVDRLRAAFSGLSKISVAGLELEFKAQIEDAAKARNIAIDPAVARQIGERMTRLGPRFATTRVLWIDDAPAGNRRELRLLKDLGASIDLALNDAEARLQLRSGLYDIVVSDMNREGDADRGRTFLPEILAAVLKPEVIFYVGALRDTPAGAFGLSNRPDTLFNLILDVLDRKA